MGSNSSRPSYSTPLTGKIKFNRNYVLGAGNAIVYSGTYKGKDVAIKRIHIKPSLIEDPTEYREIITQTKLDHPNVLKILKVEHDEDFRYIVLELCVGTLKSVCNGGYSGPDLPSDQIVLKEIVAGLIYIHSNNLAHRDIKPENILISSTTTPAHIKISDFGLCKETSSRQTYTVSGPYKGTWKWMAPEQLDMMPNSYSAKQNDEAKKRGSCRSDIFSAGLVFFYFVTRGVHPYGDATNNSDEFVLKNIRINNQVNFYKLGINHFASTAIKGMIQSQPNNRKSLDQVLKILDGPLPKSFPVKITNMIENNACSSLHSSPNRTSFYGTYSGSNVAFKRPGVNRSMTFTTANYTISTGTMTHQTITQQRRC